METEAEFNGIADYYARGPYASFVQEARVPAGLELGLVRTRQPAGAFPDPPLAEISLQINPGSGAPRSLWDVGTGRRSGRYRPGTMILAPPNTQCHYEVADSFELLVVNVALGTVKKILDPLLPGFTGDFGSLHGPAFENPFVFALCAEMWREAATDTPRGRLFLEGAQLALLTALLHSGEQLAGVRSKPLRGGLAPYRLRRVEELMRERLAEDVSLDDLAGVAGLHPVYLVRAFRQATGTTPHRYLIERRVERAKELLGAGSLSIAEIALACGFASQAHLSTWFRRLVGTTPAKYRSEHI